MPLRTASHAAATIPIGLPTTSPSVTATTSRPCPLNTSGDQATPADVERIRAGLGLDRPFLIRFGEWLWQVLRGDLGVSIFTNLPVTRLIQQRLEPTVSLMVLTLILSIAVAVPMGVLAAWNQGTWIDRAIMVLAVFGFSVP